MQWWPTRLHLFLLPLNCSEQMHDYRSKYLSFWAFTIVYHIILEQKKFISLIKHSTIKGVEMPYADHRRELNRAQSHKGKSLPKHVKMKNGTWNIYFEGDMGDLWFYSKGQGIQVNLRTEIEIKSKSMPSKKEKIPKFSRAWRSSSHGKHVYFKCWMTALWE